MLTMEARVINFGQTKPFRTKKGPVLLRRRRTVYFYDKEIIHDLIQHSKIGYNRLSVEITQAEPKIDYAKLKIWELRSIASKVGIEGFFTMRKSELIKRLEEKDAKTSH